MLDVSDRLQRACSDLRELYRKEDVLCVQCDVTDQMKMVRLSRAMWIVIVTFSILTSSRSHPFLLFAIEYIIIVDQICNLH